MIYIGSKNRIAKDIYEVMEKDIQNAVAYVEPFGGGLNMASYVAPRVDVPVIVGEYNKYIAAMWQALIDGWFPEVITKEQYDDIRDNKERDLKMTGWAGIGCSYRGKWFGGFAGKVKTRDYQDEARRNVMKQLNNLSDVKVYGMSYDELDIPDGSVVYCDPPYAQTTKYKDDFDSEAFFKWAEKLSERCVVYVSEYNAPAGWKAVWQKEVKNFLSNNGISGAITNQTESLFKFEGR